MLLFNILYRLVTGKMNVIRHPDTHRDERLNLN